MTYLTKPPILKPAKLRRLGADGGGDVEFLEFNEREKTSEILTLTVKEDEFVPYQVAGPSFTIDKRTPVPISMSNSTYDKEIRFYLEPEDIEGV